MVPFFVAPDITAYFRVHAVEGLYEGRVDILRGAPPVCVHHVCQRSRLTEAEALRDARKDASQLVKMWRDR